MNARVTWNRTISGALTVSAVGVLLIVAVFAFATPTPAQAGGGCVNTMADDAVLYSVDFSGGVTETLPGPQVKHGQVLCVEGAGVFEVGFKGSAEFFLNGGHISMTNDPTSYYDGASVDGFATFLVTDADVATTFRWAPATAQSIAVYVGALRPATRPTPPPATAQPVPPPAWTVVQLPTTYKTGDTASWEVLVVTGTVRLELSSLVEFPFSTPYGVITPTLSTTTGYYTYDADLVNGKYSASLLTARAGTWKAVFTGSPGAILRMKAVAPQAPPATTTTTGLISVWKRAGDGAYVLTANCTGGGVQFNPAKHHLEGTCTGARGKIAGAPTAPWKYVPLLLIK